MITDSNGRVCRFKADDLVIVAQLATKAVVKAVRSFPRWAEGFGRSNGDSAAYDIVLLDGSVVTAYDWQLSKA